MTDEERELISETVGDALAECSGAPWPVAWDALVQLGYHQVGVPEALGGAGGGLPEAAAVLDAVGYGAAAVPFLESSLLAVPLLGACGLGDLARGVMERGTAAAIAVPTAPPKAVQLRRKDGRWLVDGGWRRMAHASAAEVIVMFARDSEHLRVVAVSGSESGVDVRPGMNLAGDPRDEVLLTGVNVGNDQVSPVLAGDEWTNVLERAALGRSLSMCGALQRTRDLTVHYATERVQFGRPLRVFQAVQHHLASIEGWVRGAKAACSAVVTHEEPFAVAATRWWTGRACREVARAAHQVHGAIGVTRELDLHRYTTRLLAWSTEYGNEHFWAVRVGELTGRGSDVEGAWRQ